MKQQQKIKFNYKKWALNSLFTMAVVGTWQFTSSNNELQGERSFASVNDTIKLDECSVATKQALENNVQIIKIAELLRQSKANVSNVQCIKWTENNQTLHIAIHSIKNILDQETAILSLFGSNITVRTTPIGSYQSLLNKGLLPLRHNDKNKSMVFEDLNQDNRPELILLTSTLHGAGLFAFEIDSVKKRLEVIEFSPDSTETYDYLAIDAKNAPAIEFEKTSSGTIIKTPNSRFSVKKDQWIKEQIQRN